MATIYIDRKDAELDADGGALVVRADGARVASLPLGGAQRVVVRRAGTLSTRLLAACMPRERRERCRGNSQSRLERVKFKFT